MKELSVEEKATAYDEAKLRMSAAYNSNRCTIGFMNEIFPELKDEDERIRKKIIALVNAHGQGMYKDEMLAWLERRGQTFTKKDIDDAYLKGVCDAKHELEKQGEQKPTEWSEENKCMLNNIIDTLKPLSQVTHSGYAINSMIDWLKSLRPQNSWKPNDLPHWKKSTLPNDNTTGFNSDYFCHKGYCINYKELFEKLPKDD